MYLILMYLDDKYKFTNHFDENLLNYIAGMENIHLGKYII